MKVPDYYAMLGVPRFYATQEEIRTAYLEQIKFFHPDAGNVSQEIATEHTQMLNQIYATLRDTQKKRAYDESLANSLRDDQARPGSPPPHSQGQRPQETRWKPPNYSGLPRRFPPWVIVLIVLLIAVVSVIGICILTSTPGGSGEWNPSPAPTLTPKVYPTNGHILYPQTPYFKGGQLTVKTSGSQHHVVRLRDVDTNELVLSVFVRAGETANVTVPEGEYVLTYAAGETWYGTGHLFGEEMSCFITDDTFPFDINTRWTVTLYPQHNGNLGTDPIDASDF